MADNLQTFKVISRGGLNTTGDVLSQGEEFPGSATKLLNYEPDLQGGYRRISGFANSYGTVTGTGSVLGVCVADGIHNGILAARKPSSGSNYLHYWTGSSWTAITSSGSPTMVGVSKVRFTRFELTGTPKIAITDGINPAAIYDGTNYVQITDSSAPTDPTMSEVFASRLWLAGDPAKKASLYHSSAADETDFSSTGAGEFNVGFDIVAIKVFRNILYVFGTNNIKRVVGNNAQDFVLESVTNNLGCLATDSVIEIGGDLLFLAPDGIRPIGGTAKIGDVNLETVSKKIHKTVQNTINTETLSGLSSVLIRSKSQFRYMFSGTSSVGILGALRENPQGGFGFEFATLFGFSVTCADSGYIGTTETIIHGDSTGKVYAQESGTSFAGSDVLSIYQTPYLYFQDPRQRKIFYDMSTYLRAEGAINVSLGIVYDFEDTDILNPANVTFSGAGTAAVYGSAIFDTTQVYDGNPSPVETAQFTGSGKSISFRFVAEDTNASHSIQGFTITYGLGDIR